MYKTPKMTRTIISRNISTEGETIEQKVERIVNNKEPIKDGAPIIYVEKKEGIQAAYNVRTDRFDVALDGVDKMQKSWAAKGENKAKMKAEKGGKGEDGKPESTHDKPGESGTGK